jgi:cell division protein FtsB
VTDAPAHHHRHQRRKRLSVAGSRTLLLLIILVVGIGGYALGLNIARREIADSKALMQQLQTESQKLKKEAADTAAVNVGLEAKIKSMQNDMDEMKPAQNTFHLKSNQSLIVGGGHLTLGLIGPPGNDSIDINVNGTRKTVVPGDVIKVEPDASNSCEVAVQSFDMFGATVNASCTPPKR